MSPQNPRDDSWRPGAYGRTYELAVRATPSYLASMPACLYLIHGEDEYLVSARAKERVAELVAPENQAFGLETIDANAESSDAALTALSQLLESLQTASFFSEQRVIWFKDVSFLVDNAVGRTQAVKARLDQLSDLIKSGLLPGQVLLVTAAKVDKRYAFYKACKATGEVEQFEASDKVYLAEKQAADRMHEVAKRLGLKMARDAAAFFLERVGTETRRIVNELEKLSLYVGQRSEVRVQDVEAVVCASRSVLAWDLADAFGRRELAGALRILRQLLFQKESPIGLIIGLEGRVRDLMVYREALDHKWLRQGGGKAQWSPLPEPIEQLFTAAMNRDPRKTHPFRINLLAEQAARFSMHELTRCRQVLTHAHERLVTASLSPGLLIEHALVRMLTPA